MPVWVRAGFCAAMCVIGTHCATSQTNASKTADSHPRAPASLCQTLGQPLTIATGATDAQTLTGTRSALITYRDAVSQGQRNTTLDAALTPSCAPYGLSEFMLPPQRIRTQTHRTAAPSQQPCMHHRYYAPVLTRLEDTPAALLCEDHEACVAQKTRDADDCWHCHVTTAVHLGWQVRIDANDANANAIATASSFDTLFVAALLSISYQGFDRIGVWAVRQGKAIALPVIPLGELKLEGIREPWLSLQVRGQDGVALRFAVDRVHSAEVELRIGQRETPQIDWQSDIAPFVQAQSDENRLMKRELDAIARRIAPRANSLKRDSHQGRSMMVWTQPSKGKSLLQAQPILCRQPR